MGATGKDASERRGRKLVVRNVIQSGSPGGTDFCIRFEGPFRRNGKDGGRDEHMVPATYHREAGVEEPIQDMVDANGGGSYVGSGNAVRGYMHWNQAGGGSQVGGVAPYF